MSNSKSENEPKRRKKRETVHLVNVCPLKGHQVVVHVGHALLLQPCGQQGLSPEQLDVESSLTENLLFSVVLALVHGKMP